MNSPFRIIEKVVVGVGLGRMRSQAHFDDKILPEIMKEVSLLTGQRPSPRPAKKSIAGFKMREGDVVGLKVTLRGSRMTDFLTRLTSVVLPRVKDFRGISPKIIDSCGNLTIGLRDKQVFPEIDSSETRLSFGIQITIVPKEINDDMPEFYRSLGIPLIKT